MKKAEEKAMLKQGRMINKASYQAGALDLLGEKITTPLENFMKTVHLERAWPVVLEFGKSSLTAAWMPEYGRYAALGITDSSMFIVPMSKKPPHNPVDDKYCVELMFKNIVSFDVSVEEAKGMKKGLIGVETNMTITVDNGDEYAIRLQEHSRFYKLVLAAWDSCTIRKASGSGEVSAELDKYLAEQYHDESLQCLQLTKKIDEVEKIFNEYAEECFLDLRLKEWTIEKREMFAIAIKWIRRCWGKLTKDERNLFTKRELSPQRQFEIDAVRSLSPEKVAENERDKENKLKLVAYRRMKCIQACLNMIVSCLYSSEVCDHKICLLHGPYPLESYDWVQVLMEDALECVYKSLGIKVDAKVESLAAEEIEQTMSRTFRNSQSHGVSTFPSMNFSSSPSSSMMDERQGPLSGRISAVVKNFDDDILTPMKQRFFEQYNLQGQFSSKLDDNIQKLVRSIRDMQAFALFELAKVTAVGRVNKEKSRQDQYKAVSPLGYTITRFPWWTVGIEALVIRVSGLLDDILSSQEVFDHFNRKIRIKTKRKPLSALIDDVIADDYTGYGRPAEHNQSVPPSPTKQDYNDGLVSSSLEGSFSPMRNISQSKTPRGKISNISASPRDVVCISALETQEILLFTIVHLLQSLCKDSSKIRELFRYELADYWLSIFNVVNKLCPRPDVIVQSYGADHPKVLRSPSRLNKSTKSTKKKSLSGKNPPRKPSGGPIDEKGEEPAYGHCVYVSGIPPTSITDFGEAKYGMTKATWQLLIKSRLAVEDIVVTSLGFHVDIFRHVDSDEEIDELEPATSRPTSARSQKKGLSSSERSLSKRERMDNMASARDELERIKTTPLRNPLRDGPVRSTSPRVAAPERSEKSGNNRRVQNVMNSTPRNKLSTGRLSDDEYGTDDDSNYDRRDRNNIQGRLTVITKDLFNDDSNSYDKYSRSRD